MTDSGKLFLLESSLRNNLESLAASNLRISGIHYEEKIMRNAFTDKRFTYIFIIYGRPKNSKIRTDSTVITTALHLNVLNECTDKKLLPNTFHESKKYLTFRHGDVYSLT